MADVLVYRVSVDAAAGDVVERLLTVTVDGQEDAAAAKTFEPSATDLGTVRVPQDAEVVLSLVDVDDVGNKSEPAVLSFTAKDTVPPPAPGGFGVALVGEESQSA